MALGQARSWIAGNWRSMEWRIAALTLLGVSITMAAYGLWLARDIESTHVEARAQTARILGEMTAKSLAAPMWDFDMPVVAHTLEALKLDQDVVAASVRDAGGRIVESIGDAAAPASLASSTHPILYRSPDGPERLGTLSLTLDSQRIDAIVRAARNQHLTVSAGMAAALLLVLWMIARSVVHPMRALHDNLVRLKDGDLDTTAPVVTPYRELRAVDATIRGFVRDAREIRDLRAERDRLTAQDRTRVLAAVEGTDTAIVLINERREPVFANDAARTMVPMAEDGKLPSVDFAPLVGWTGRRTAVRIARAVSRRESVQGEFSVAATDQVFSFKLFPIGTDDAPLGMAFLIFDVTEKSKAQTEIERLANRDPLTDLPNRRSFERLLRADAGGAEEIALLMLDLDRFKQINDTMGHPAGDELLKVVARRLKSSVRGSDSVARLGGDEFAVVLRGRSLRGEARRAAERIITQLAVPIDIDGQNVVTGATVGIALDMSTGLDADDLVRRADLALYRAKDNERGTMLMHEPRYDESVRERRSLEARLRAAVEREEIGLAYQRQRSLVDMSDIGFEALARWSPSEGGSISPGAFIPLAEETGLILPLTEQLLLRAARVAGGLVEAGRDERVAVNLSPRLMARAPARMIEAACAEAGCEPSRIEVEVTEAVFLSDTRENHRALNELRELGVTLALDDFGTGYSSLSTLLTFPMDRLKIDRAFVSALGETEDVTSIVRTIIALGHDLGMAITAEGVETQLQLATLRALGCDSVQGFLVGRPEANAHGLAIPSDTPLAMAS